MADRTEPDPTMEEIVVALRETKRGASRMPPLTVVGGQPGVNRRSGVAGNAANWTVGPSSIAELRDDEIERLLAENARLNERVMFLLKAIEHDQARNAEFAADHAAIETNRDVNVRDLRAAVEAELRPVLQVMLRLLEKQRGGHEAADPATRRNPTTPIGSSISMRSTRDLAQPNDAKRGGVPLARSRSGDSPMTTAAASQQAVKGLDLGTSRIVLATLHGQNVNFTPQLNAFVDIPFSKMTEQMLGREHILHQVEGAHIYAYGNRADEFAKFLGGDTRRPMQSGLLNPAEPKNLEMIGLLLEHLCGKASKGEKLCLSIPSAPAGHGSDLIFHQRSVQGIFEKLGYQAQSVNEGLAIVYSELKDANFTGIGMSFGGGMCNICLAYLGLPVLAVATTRAGDYIDHSAASVTGETPTTVRLHKENAAESGFKLNGGAGGAIDRALAVYYADVIETAVTALQTAMVETNKLPRFRAPIPIVCAGGTTMAGNFLAKLKAAIAAAELPVAISEVYLAKDPFNATAKGALVGAMLNM